MLLKQMKQTEDDTKRVMRQVLRHFLDTLGCRCSREERAKVEMSL